MHVCIVGGGIVGTALAYQLIQAGVQTTLIEAEPDLGQKTSFANAGQLSYSYVAPLADPAVFADLPAWLLKRDSPLKFRPSLSYDQWRWLTHFLFACRQSVQAQSTAVLLALSGLSRDTLHQWILQDDLSFNHAANGKLIVHDSQKSWESAQKQFARQKELGSDQSLLSPEELIALEPALAPMQARVKGAVYTPSEEVGDCYLLIKAMQGVLEQSPHFHLIRQTAAQGFRVQGQTAHALMTHAGEIEADQYVVCAGIESQSLLKPLGYNPVLFALKGYSLTLAAGASNALFPKISVTDYARRIVYAPLGQKLRIAAMIDIHKNDDRVDPQRIAILKQQVQQSFPEIDHLDQAQVWAGLRPATPTGRPLIGRCPGQRNVWMNIGHGALGFTLAAGSAQLLSELMLDQKPSIDPSSFMPH